MVICPVHEANDCHAPAGSPAGGQFCGDAPTLAGSPAFVRPAVTNVPLTSAEEYARDTYASLSHWELAKALRVGTPLSHAYAYVVQHLDAAMDRNHFTAPVTLYRAVQTVIPTGAIGSTFTDASYVSTTAAKGFTSKHAQGEGHHVLLVQIPSGTPVVAVPSFEQEYILPRNSTFEIVRRDTGVTVIRVRR